MRQIWTLTISFIWLCKLILPSRGFTIQDLREPYRSVELHHNDVNTAHASRNLSVSWCGTPEKISRNKRFVKSPSKWKKNLLSFRFENYTPDMDISSTRLAIYHAFGEWSKYARLDFYELFHGKADIVIKFGGRSHGDKYYFDGEGNVLAHAFSPGRGIGGDVHFDEDEAWGFGSHEGTDLFVVAAHEIGHALGLYHSNAENALMNPTYPGYQENFRMPTDDINGIRYIYGGRGRQDPSRPTIPPLPKHKHTTRVPGGTRGTGGKHGIFGKSPDGMLPEPCLMSYDAVTVIRGERHVFIKRWYWRYTKKGLVPGYPSEVRRMFKTLDPSFSSIDASYVRTDNQNIVFFIGETYFEYELVRGDSGPLQRARKSLRDLGLPAAVTRVDAALVWGPSKHTYLISGEMYWILEGYRVTKSGRISNVWPGVPYPVDSAFVHWDGKTYFFKGFRYWQYDDVTKSVKSIDGEPIKGKWMECKGVNVPVEKSSTVTSQSPNTTYTSGHRRYAASIATVLAVGVVYLNM